MNQTKIKIVNLAGDASSVRLFKRLFGEVEFASRTNPSKALTGEVEASVPITFITARKAAGSMKKLSHRQIERKRSGIRMKPADPSPALAVPTEAAVQLFTPSDAPTTSRNPAATSKARASH